MITFDMEKYTQKGTFIGLKRVTAPDHTTSKRLDWVDQIISPPSLATAITRNTQNLP